MNHTTAMTLPTHLLHHGMTSAGQRLSRLSQQRIQLDVNIHADHTWDHLGSWFGPAPSPVHAAIIDITPGAGLGAMSLVVAVTPQHYSAMTTIIAGPARAHDAMISASVLHEFACLAAIAIAAKLSLLVGNTVNPGSPTVCHCPWAEVVGHAVSTMVRHGQQVAHASTVLRLGEHSAPCTATLVCGHHAVHAVHEPVDGQVQGTAR